LWERLWECVLMRGLGDSCEAVEAGARGADPAICDDADLVRPGKGRGTVYEAPPLVPPAKTTVCLSGSKSTLR
jgi:hypothetical protein